MAERTQKQHSATGSCSAYCSYRIWHEQPIYYQCQGSSHMPTLSSSPSTTLLSKWSLLAYQGMEMPHPSWMVCLREDCRNIDDIFVTICTPVNGIRLANQQLTHRIAPLPLKVILIDVYFVLGAARHLKQDRAFRSVGNDKFKSADEMRKVKVIRAECKKLNTRASCSTMNGISSTTT